VQYLRRDRKDLRPLLALGRRVRVLVHAPADRPDKNPPGSPARRASRPVPSKRLHRHLPVRAYRCCLSRRPSDDQGRDRDPSPLRLDPRQEDLAARPGGRRARNARVHQGGSQGEWRATACDWTGTHERSRAGTCPKRCARGIRSIGARSDIRINQPEMVVAIAV
jgi:hypothetical protein